MIETEVAGRKTIDATGPKSSTGYFLTMIKVKKGGYSEIAVEISGEVNDRGDLVIETMCHKVGREDLVIVKQVIKKEEI